MRPLVVCRSAHRTLEDILGNKGLVVSLAADRLLSGAVPPAMTRRLLVAIRNSGKEIGDLRDRITPCDQCNQCGTIGIILDLEV